MIPPKNPKPASTHAILLSILIQFLIPADNVCADNGKVTGRVYDGETEQSLPGANVIIESQWEFGKDIEVVEKQGASSDLEGYYFILNVPPGTYDIKASMMGYTPIVQRKVRVNADRTITIDFPLTSTILEMEAVEVVAKREVIKPDVSGTQEIITTDRILETPVLRIDEFARRIKGVELVANNDGHGLSIRGGSVRETDVRLDGISARDPRSENAYLSLNSTSVEELQLLTGGFEAKYGGFRSGLVNVVTKEGNREKYSFSFKADYTPFNRKKFFGASPWSDESWIYRVFADTSETGFAWIGTRGDTTGLVPAELSSFKGWLSNSEGRKNYEAIGLPKGTKLTPDQKRQLWLLQHPQYEIATKPDMYLEGTVTGPMPGRWIPVVGDILKKSTFLLAGKYENTQFAFPLGPRPDYVDWNSQLKITSNITSRSKLSLNFLYAEVETNTANRPSTLGGALMEYSSRFSFLSSTQRSLEQQARILGSGNGFASMFNRSRLQYLDQRWILGGVRFNQTISSKAFFVLDFQLSYTDNEINPFSADTSKEEAWTMIDSFPVLKYPTIGTPNSSTNSVNDLTNLFFIYGGLQQVDSSYSWAATINGDLTAQVGRYHEFETGFSVKYTYSYVYSGTWFQSEKLWTPGVPDTWQYYTIKPVEAGIYVQDKLEFQGMIASVGLRVDYFNPNKKYYLVQHPLDKDFANLYHLEYDYLPGKWGSWERWEEFREMLSSPPGWPAKKNRTQLKLSPRLGVSFPVAAGSKLYFNYGHFYQRPNFTFLYNLAISTDEAVVPSPDLDMAKTVSYEFGYEQSFLRDFLFNITLYYKDISNEPLRRTYIDYWQEFQVSRYLPDSFADTRGIELRLEKNFGRFVTFWANYEYMLRSWGQTGLRYLYENRIIAKDEERSPNVTTTEPIPKAHFNINLHTPQNWGISFFGLKPLSGIFVDFLYDWEDGGKLVIDEDPLTGEQRKTDIIDYTNLDLRASKMIGLGGVNLEFVLTVTNLLNQKRLYTSGMSTAQSNRYKESLHFPFEEGEENGNDKWGEWDKDHIDIGWFTAPLFLNPRQILLGARVSF